MKVVIISDIHGSFPAPEASCEHYDELWSWATSSRLEFKRYPYTVEATIDEIGRMRVSDEVKND